MPERSRATNTSESASKKWTRHASTAESGSISRGKYTFRTRSAFPTTLWMLATMPPTQKFHARIPIRTNTAK